MPDVTPIFFAGDAFKLISSYRKEESLANHKSAIKRNRQNVKRYARNKVYRTQLKNATKKVLAEVEAKDKQEAEKVLKGAIKTIAKVASKGVIHKRAASRKISGLSKKVNQLSASA